MLPNKPIEQPSNGFSTSTYVRKASRPRAKRAVGTKRKRLPAKTTRVVRKGGNLKLETKISDCGLQYLSALVDPFNTPPGACIPADLFVLPSQKIRVFSRGNFSLGTTGVGFIAFNPTSANDAACIRATSATSVGTTATILGSFTNTVDTMIPTLPYPSVSFGNTEGVQARVVAAGIRIRYSGTEASRQGTLFSMEEQDHQSLILSTWSNNSSMVNVTCKRPSGAGDWDSTVCLSGPVVPNDLDFQSVVFPTTVTQSVVGAYLAIQVQGLAADLYQYECFEHIEYVGRQVPTKTISHSDQQAYAAISATVKTNSAQQSLEPEAGPGILSQVMSYMQGQLPNLVSIGRGVATALGGNPIGGVMAALPGAYGLSQSINTIPHMQGMMGVAAPSLLGGKNSPW